MKREPSTSIVDIKDDKEAIFLLAHLVGDLHQHCTWVPCISIIRPIGLIPTLKAMLKSRAPKAATFFTMTRKTRSILSGMRYPPRMKTSLHWCKRPQSRNAYRTRRKMGRSVGNRYPANERYHLLAPQNRCKASVHNRRSAFGEMAGISPQTRTIPHHREKYKRCTTELAGAHLADIFNSLWP